MNPSPVDRKLYAAGFRDDHVQSLRQAKSVKVKEGNKILPRRHAVIVSGWALTGIQLPEGQRQELQIYMPGDLMDVRAIAFPPECQTLALTDVSAILLPEAIVENPMFATLLEAETEQSRQRMFGHVLRLGRFTAVQRIAHLLQEVDARWREAHPAHRGPMPFPITQTNIADYLALSVIHVNRCMQMLRKSGAVTANKRGLEIINADLLETFVRSGAYKKAVVPDLDQAALS